MSIEQLGHKSPETTRTPEQIQQEIDEEIAKGSPETASRLQAELLGLPLDTPDTIPEGITVTSINELHPDDSDPLAKLTPRHIGFLRDTAQRRATGEAGYATLREANIGPERAKLAVALTGHYILDSQGNFTAIGAGDTLFGNGTPEQVRDYLDSLGFEELIPGYDQSGSNQLETIMPNVALTLYNRPSADTPAKY